MNILAVVPLYPPHSLVGAWLTTHEYLADLAARGHRVDVVTYLADRDAPYELDGVTVHPGRTTFPTSAHDVVVGHAGDRRNASSTAHGRPLVTMVHGTIAHPADLDRSALVVFNSEHMQQSTVHTAPSIVARPTTDRARYRATPGDLVTLINLSQEKGGYLLWRLAKRMPERRFLAVRNGYQAQIVRHAPNVETVGGTTDMAGDVYARTRILLVPSARESWGRVAVEALASGIPVIAHPTPGLKEALGDAGIFIDRRDAAGWVAAIRRLDSPERWAEASTRAIRRSLELDFSADRARFAETVETLVGFRQRHVLGVPA